MKKYCLIIALFWIVLSFSQTQTESILYVKSDSLFLKPYTFKGLDWKPKISFNALEFYSKYDLSLYNRATGFNDNYMLYNGKAEYINSQYVDFNGIFNNKLDSFNPNGATEMGGALITGVCNMLLDLIEKKP